MPVSIDILMSTYNGERFIRDQLDSIFNQSMTNWRLIIRDDGSSDDTCQIVFEYQEKAPEKIFFIEDEEKKLGACQSFFRVTSHSCAQYIFFCDQDDVWEPNKLQIQIEKMLELEMNHGESIPILIHTDLSVVDDQLNLIGESFWKYQHLCPDKMSSLPRLLTQNCVTGCTVLINRPLAELAMPFPRGVIMHDWWLALIAVSEGIVCDMKVTTVKYRQHDNNDTGAKLWGVRLICKALIHGRGPLLKSLLSTRIQAEALMSADVLSDVNRRIVEKYVSLYDRNWFMRRIEMLRSGFFKYGVIRNIALFLLL